MIDSLEIYRELVEEFGERAAEKLSQVVFRVYEEARREISREDFLELKEVVKNLVESVDKLSGKVEGLITAQIEMEKRMGELVEAQSKTEEEVKELAQAQARTEERLNALAERVDELAQAQARTEKRVDELTQRLDALTKRVDELAQAQAKTEERLNALAKRVDDLAKRVEELTESQKKIVEQLAQISERVELNTLKIEGLSHSFGYYLENEVYKHLPKLLRDKGVIVKGRLVRKYVQAGEKLYQVNIYGKAEVQGKEVLILGEVKTRITKKEVNRFAKVVRRIQLQEQVDVYPVVVAHDFRPEVEILIRDKGMDYYWTYEFS